MPTSDQQARFIEGVLVALGLSVLGGIGFWLLPRFVGLESSILLLQVATTSIYAFYLIKRSGRCYGKLASGTAVLIGSAIALLIPMSLIVVAAIALFCICALRCVYFRRGLIASAVDLGLTLSGVFAALLAAATTHSAFLTIWTFLLVQALHVFIPAHGSRSTAGTTPEGRFDKAFNNAENALRQFYAKAAHS